MPVSDAFSAVPYAATIIPIQFWPDHMEIEVHRLADQTDSQRNTGTTG